MFIEPSMFASRLLNKPVALHPNYFAGAMAMRDSDFDDPYGYTGYEVSNGIANIQVSGVLYQSLGIPYSLGFATGYDSIRLNFLKALADPEAKAIAFSISSGGGEVSGCFDLADLIYRARGQKPMWAILSEDAYSAAYAIASATDHITVPRTGGTGSIGVIAARCDWSEAMTAAGIKVRFITYGAYKAEGHPEVPITDEEIARYQAQIDQMGELFTETVARNRNIAAATVADMQAATFLGEKGVALGLADEVAAPDAAFRALIAKIAA